MLLKASISLENNRNIVKDCLILNLPVCTDIRSHGLLNLNWEDINPGGNWEKSKNKQSGVMSYWENQSTPHSKIS